ncbi:MAG: hypothetical protein GC155_18150 [Alphaproteobacteria bacterium]|nr:hypothetical protein [Alphaproteobacteria bacterium]
MMRRPRLVAGLAAGMAAMLLAACGIVTSTNRSVFVLFDASGTYVKSVPDAARWTNLLVSNLQPGDWIGVGQISSCSFSDKEVVLQERLPETPSRASEAKRALFTRLRDYSGTVKSTKHTDIHGALAQAAFELRQRPEKARYIVVFSDMIEDLAPKCDTSKVALDLKGITVVASNVIKSDPGDPDKYFASLKAWEKAITDAGGTWLLATSPDQLPDLVTK